MASSDSATARGMWLAVATGFLALAVAWTALFLAARHTRVQEVPLQTKGGGPR